MVCVCVCVCVCMSSRSSNGIWHHTHRSVILSPSLSLSLFSLFFVRSFLSFSPLVLQVLQQYRNGAEAWAPMARQALAERPGELERLEAEIAGWGAAARDKK